MQSRRRGRPAAQRAEDLAALASGGRINIAGFALRLAARLPFLFIAGRVYGPDLVGRFALAVVVVELAALIATLGLKRGLALALASDDRPQVDIVWDAMAVALVASLCVTTLLFAFPVVMFPDSRIVGLERDLPIVIFASALADVALAALAYRRNVRAAVTARAVLEPWTISLAAWGFSFVSLRDGLVAAYMLSVFVALVASLVPFVASYGVPRRWRPAPGRLIGLARRNAPLAGADAVEWATRNVDRFILGLLFEPRVVGIYYMAQQVASLPAKLKSSFDPILGPVIASSLARGDRAAVAQQVRQVGFWIMAAQAGLALMGTIPGRAVMGVIGPQFVAGTAAMGFLLAAEVAAATGSVCESALIYVARHLNLTISAGILLAQIGLSIALITAMRQLGWPGAWQAAGPAVALLVAMAASSLIKSATLGRLLRAGVSGWRWPLVGAALVATAVGSIFTALPHHFEWTQVVIGVPAIAASYLYVLWRWAFGPADRALFRTLPSPPIAALPA